MIGTEVKFIIDNFSGIIDVDEWLSYYEANKNVYPRSKMKPKFIDTKLNGIYILYDNNKEPIYIGKSNNCIRQRLLNHLKNKSKSENTYEYLFTLYKRNKFKYFSYIICEDVYTGFLEYYFIKKYNPRYNIEFNKSFEYEDEWLAFYENSKEKKIEDRFKYWQNKKYLKDMKDVVI